MTFRVTLFVSALALFSLSATAQVQKIMTLAGNGTAGFSGDGYGAAAAMLWGPTDVALDTNMNLYVVDYNNFRIRKITQAGIITTVAGTGNAGNAGNGSIATSADIAPKCIAFDRKGNMFFSDPTNNVIRKVNKLGIISLYAGKGIGAGVGYTGDGGKADTARFRGPLGLAVDDTGNLYVCDAGNHVVRKIDTSRNITTIAGTGIAGYGGDGFPAVGAMLDSPYSVAVTRNGTIYINDYKNLVIRAVDDTGGISTYAGTYATPGYSGDNGPAVLAQLDDARGIAVDTFGNLFIADALNNVIRKVNYATGFITTAVGNHTPGFGGDGNYVEGANLFNPYGVAVDVRGSIYIADANNERIRKTYSTVSVKNLNSNVSLQVYPNPCYTDVTISGLEAGDKLVMTDMMGRQAGEPQVVTASSQQLSVEQLASGMYMVQAFDANGARKACIQLVKE